MLILTRRVGESVIIEGGIQLTVLGIKGSQVRIGIKAPAGVNIVREELFERFKNKEQEAPAASASAQVQMAAAAK